MAKVPNAVEISPQIWTVWVGCTSVTDRRQTDGWQRIANVNVSSRSLKTRHTSVSNNQEHCLSIGLHCSLRILDKIEEIGHQQHKIPIRIFDSFQTFLNFCELYYLPLFNQKLFWTPHNCELQNKICYEHTYIVDIGYFAATWDEFSWCNFCKRCVIFLVIFASRRRQLCVLSVAAAVKCVSDILSLQSAHSHDWLLYRPVTRQ